MTAVAKLSDELRKRIGELLIAGFTIAEVRSELPQLGLSPALVSKIAFAEGIELKGRRGGRPVGAKDSSPRKKRSAVDFT